MRRADRRLVWMAVAAMALSAAEWSVAQPGRRGRRPDGAGGAPAAAPAAPKPVKYDNEEEARYLAIVGATVHTVSGPTLEGATVLCRNGRIHAVGNAVAVPERAQVLDAAGLRVYPGFVAVRSQGILGSGARPEDESNVFSLNVALALTSGITSMLTGETVAKNTWGTLDDMVVKRDALVTLRYSTSDPAGRRRVRESLERLRRHLREVADHEARKARGDEDSVAPDDQWIRGEHAQNLRLLKGEARAMVDAHAVGDLLGICDLAETYGIKVVVRGAAEAWIVAPRLARANIDVILTPRTQIEPDKRLNRHSGSTIENAAILAAHGVRTAFIPSGSLFGPGYQISLGGLAGRDLLNLPLEAAFAVRGGMSGRDAIRALTLDAAAILGVDDRVGSIDVGKDADLVVTDGDPLSYMTHARWTIVNGRVVYDKLEDSLLSHVRPSGPGADRAPKPDDIWPRRLGAPWGGQ